MQRVYTVIRLYTQPPVEMYLYVLVLYYIFLNFVICIWNVNGIKKNAH